MRSKILVLMSVYNGEKFLGEQIHSILNQQMVDLHLLVRDDGSKDKSLVILNEYASHDRRIEIVAEKNLGCIGSFNALVDIACKKIQYDYFAFSDQDDIWLPQKLYAGLSRLEACNNEEKNLPLMYFCNLMIADANAKPLFPLRKYPLKMKRANMLQTNKAAGCTMVFNRKMAEIYKKRPAVYPSLHDRWIMLIAMFTGKVFYDHNCYIYYRQHSNNVVGMHGLLSAKDRWRQRIYLYLNENKNKECAIVRTFREMFYDDLSDTDRQLMFVYSEYRRNWLYKFSLLINSDFYPDTPPLKNIMKHVNYALKLILGKL